MRSPNPSSMTPSLPLSIVLALVKPIQLLILLLFMGKVKKSEKKQEIGTMTKVTACHDIWGSGQYTDKFWRPEIYKTIYRKDYGNK